MTIHSSVKILTSLELFMYERSFIFYTRSWSFTRTFCIDRFIIRLAMSQAHVSMISTYIYLNNATNLRQSS